MRYSYEFKLKCIELYKEGKWPDTPKGVTTAVFRKNIRLWKRTVEAVGPEALKHTIKDWTAEERYELVAEVLDGQPITAVAINHGINPGQLHQWVRKYKEFGYNGLEIKKGKKPKDPNMKTENNKSEKLNESEQEELIRIRAELARVKTENAVLKKRLP